MYAMKAIKSVSLIRLQTIFYFSLTKIPDSVKSPCHGLLFVAAMVIFPVNLKGSCVFCKMSLGVPVVSSSADWQTLFYNLMLVPCFCFRYG
jgi:hypothetical protein